MRQPRSTPQVMHRAAELRKEMTIPEQRLWARLRKNQILDTAFRRQHAIGPYIVDFCAVKIRMVVELDGSPHKTQEEYDEQRTKFLEDKGYHVLRFWNHEVIDHLDRVVGTIETEVEEITRQHADR